MNRMTEASYDIEQARRAILSMQAQADTLEDRADELRDLADEWGRQVANLRMKAIDLAVRISQDEEV